MKIRELIKELEKELDRGDEEIYVIHNSLTSGDKLAYDFELGIDNNGQPLIVMTQPEHITH